MMWGMGRFGVMTLLNKKHAVVFCQVAMEACLLAVLSTTEQLCCSLVNERSNSALLLHMHLMLAIDAIHL